MAYSEVLTALNYRLAQLYRNEDEALRLAELAGINTSAMNLDTDPIQRWFKILYGAYNAFGDGGNWTKIVNLLSIVTSTVERGAQDSYLLGLNNTLQLNQLPIHKPELSNWKTEHANDSFEIIIRLADTLLPITFMEHGIECARSVARVVVGNNIGTGFLASNNFLITTHHLIQTEIHAETAIIQFNFQATRLGDNNQLMEMGLAPSLGFNTDKDGDYTIVKMNGDANTHFGALDLGTVPAQKGEFVSIIQHPGGGPKQIAMYHNVITFADSHVVQYLTPTVSGSSGSPIFNKSWQVIAMHNSGGSSMEQITGLALTRNSGLAIAIIADKISSLNLQP
jgi:hypothetical protein